MTKRKPRDNIERIRGNLDKAKNRTAKALGDITFQQEVINSIDPYWEYITAIPSSGAVASTASAIEFWAQESEQVISDANALVNRIVLTSGIAANVASSTGILADIEGDNRIRFVSEKASKVVSKWVRREKIMEALNSINRSLANEFYTTWQYMSYPVSDPGRGPFVQMRHVFDHFLDIMAPDSKVESEPGFIPDAKLKSKDGKGITRKHKVEFFAKNKVKDKSYSEAILKSWRAFNDTYKKLNSLHKRGQLDEEKVKAILTQGETVLQLWLKSIGSLP